MSQQEPKKIDVGPEVAKLIQAREEQYTSLGIGLKHFNEDMTKLKEIDNQIIIKLTEKTEDKKPETEEAVAKESEEAKNGS